MRGTERDMRKQEVKWGLGLAHLLCGRPKMLSRLADVAPVDPGSGAVQLLKIFTDGNLGKCSYGEDYCERSHDAGI